MATSWIYTAATQHTVSSRTCEAYSGTVENPADGIDVYTDGYEDSEQARPVATGADKSSLPVARITGKRISL